MFKIDNIAQHPIWRQTLFINELQQLASIHFGLRRIDAEEVRSSRGRYFEAIRKYAIAEIGELAGQKLQDDAGAADSPWQQFLTFQTTKMKSTAHYDALALFVLDDILRSSVRTDQQIKNVEKLLSRHRLPAIFKLYRCAAPNVDELALNRATGQTEAGDVFEASEIEYRTASAFLTRLDMATDSGRIASAVDFFVYRYSSIPGHIAKSVMRIYPPTQAESRCRFENLFKFHDGSIRHSSGNVFRREDWIYFMGVDDPARRPKCIVVRAIGRIPPTNGICFIPIPLTPESAAGQRFVDEHPHGHRGVHDQLRQRSGGDAADALGLAAVVAECELVEIGLQMFRLNRARVRAEQPALQQ